MANTKLLLDGNSLTLEQIENFIQNNIPVALTPTAQKKVERARKLIDEWVDQEKVVYGVTTGFGDFSNVTISKEESAQLQENLIMSHAVGAGELLPLYIVKIMMLLRVNALAKGHSGIHPETLQLLIDMMNHNIIPAVPSQGSVGSSGDLVPLSHIALSLLGKGQVFIQEDLFARPGKPVAAPQALKKFKLKPVQLRAKEGLSLINGTQMMTAFAAYICARAQRLQKTADVAAALSHEALRATDNAYDARLHKLRPYKGQADAAKNMLNLIKGSGIRESHRKNDTRVQDAYSLRCIPQVHGASRDAIAYVCNQVSIEINSANDNPLLFPDDGDHREGGNFHGQPVALPMDFMAIALSELANISERRTERLVNGTLSGLPRFLAKEGGLNSGLMIAQYTAASIVSENKVLSHPASVDSIPTSANQEDHNSMGSIAARKCLKVMQNLEVVLAVELMAAAQGLEFLKPLTPGKGTGIAYRVIRDAVKPLDKDRILYEDLNRVTGLVKGDTILNAVEREVSLR